MHISIRGCTLEKVAYWIENPPAQPQNLKSRELADIGIGCGCVSDRQA